MGPAPSRILPPPVYQVLLLHHLLQVISGRLATYDYFHGKKNGHIQRISWIWDIGNHMMFGVVLEMKDLSQFIASHMTHEKNGLSFKSLDSFLHPVFGQTQLVQLVMAWPCLKRHHGHGVESKKNTTCVNFPSKEDLWYSRSWASAKIYSRTPNCEANLVGKKNVYSQG